MPKLVQDKLSYLCADLEKHPYGSSYGDVVTVRAFVSSVPSTYMYRFENTGFTYSILIKSKGYLSFLKKVFLGESPAEKEIDKFDKLVESFIDSRKHILQLPYVHTLQHFYISDRFGLGVPLMRLGFSFDPIKDPFDKSSKIYKLAFPNIYPDGKVSTGHLLGPLTRLLEKETEINLSNIIETCTDLNNIFWEGLSVDQIALCHFTLDSNIMAGAVDDKLFENYHPIMWSAIFSPFGVVASTVFDPYFEKFRKTELFKKLEKSAPLISPSNIKVPVSNDRSSKIDIFPFKNLSKQPVAKVAY